MCLSTLTLTRESSSALLSSAGSGGGGPGTAEISPSLIAFPSALVCSPAPPAPTPPTIPEPEAPSLPPNIVISPPEIGVRSAASSSDPTPTNENSSSVIESHPPEPHWRELVRSVMSTRPRSTGLLEKLTLTFSPNMRSTREQISSRRLCSPSRLLSSVTKKRSTAVSAGDVVTCARCTVSSQSHSTRVTSCKSPNRSCVSTWKMYWSLGARRTRGVTDRVLGHDSSRRRFSSAHEAVPTAPSSGRASRTLNTKKHQCPSVLKSPLSIVNPKSNITRAKSHPSPVASGQLMRRLT
mmetsp:Transcript_25413/g.83580  ORF Transcript_25413/g.83580 Transcript_25413/m.83580 type:complete len:295 (+) Transcript_25413:1079-1963(+)